MVGDCLRSTREAVRLQKNHQLKSCFGGSFCLCCLKGKSGVVGECLFSTEQLREILGKEKPRGLTPVGVIVLLAAIRLLRVLHASNP